MKPVNNFDGLYDITDNGTIVSLERVSQRGKALYHQKEKVIKTHHDKDGYLNARLCKNNKVYNVKVHRAVAETYIPNPDNLPQVNHKNGIKDDNRVENLEWVDNLTNMRHAIKTGLMNNVGENNGGGRKLTAIQVQEIRKLKGSMKVTEMVKKYNVTHTMIYNILKNNNWK